ncbi:hypothetical protein [Actinoplanes sp. OR16]|uniref:hypothetical protein n=1 Tax=Actinoplanes sp. OR16 TaxID=946334 RepID=UPI000FDBFB77|nr:hypothetical protein [Actinoplanes sp. OR16]
MSRTPLLRPTLIPGLPRYWRGPDELQLGLDPAHAVVLRLPDPRTAKVLDLLDGDRSERAVLIRAAELGVPPDESRALLDLLHQAGLVLPAARLLPATMPAVSRARLSGEAAALALTAAAAPVRRTGDRAASAFFTSESSKDSTSEGGGDRASESGGDRADGGDLSPAGILQRRQRAKVVLSGRGRLGAPIAVALAEAGVGHVYPDLVGSVGAGEVAGGPLGAGDAGSPRRSAVATAVMRAAPGTKVHGVRRSPATVVVQLAHDEPVAVVAAAHAARRQPHLAVTVRDGAAVIGPFVPAGGAPCLHCVDLHRRDRDAGWPSGPATAVPGAEPCAVATLLAATAYATAEILAHLDGRVPETLGAAVQISSPGRLRRRTWPPHPDCDCRRRARSFTGPSPHKPNSTMRRAE